MAQQIEALRLPKSCTDAVVVKNREIQALQKLHRTPWGRNGIDGRGVEALAVDDVRPRAPRAFVASGLDARALGRSRVRATSARGPAASRVGMIFLLDVFSRAGAIGSAMV